MQRGGKILFLSSGVVDGLKVRKAGWSSVIESCRKEVPEAGKLVMESLSVMTEINHGH